MAIRGISHVTFVVADLTRTARLFCEGLGAREVYDSAGREHSLSREKFFVLGDLWLVAMQGTPLAERSYRHVAFAVDAADLPGYRTRLQALGVEILPGRGRIDGEGEPFPARRAFHDRNDPLSRLANAALHPPGDAGGEPGARKLQLDVAADRGGAFLDLVGKPGLAALAQRPDIAGEHLQRRLQAVREVGRARAGA